MPRLIAFIVIPSILLVLGAACGSDDEPASAPTAAPTSAPAATTAPPATGQPAGKVLDVINHDQGGSGKYEFEPNEFNFKVGETVTLRLTSETEFHTYTVDDLGIDVAVEAGETVEFTFTFDQAGTFGLICIPHESLGMVGAITVQ
ncbi:MAG: plastocyanin/azurin family copper-binding protein [Chloroflexi bacterium]|nr:plastocyanin/azurin family copper-binding protein [Chloroflexota bacterium]